MRLERVDESLLVRYLLGDLSEEEQVRVEDRAFSDAEYLGALEAVEADLIDAWVRGDLQESQRRKFESRFLISPRRRSKVEFAGALAKVAAETRGAELAPSRQSRGWESLSSLIHGWNPALRLAAGLAVVILVAGASWLVVQNLVMGSRIGVLEAERHDGAERERGLHRQIGDEQRHAADLAAQLEQQHSQTAAAHGIASLILLPGLSRAQSRVPQLSLDASAQIAHIQIQLDPRDDFPRFRAELRTRRGQDVLTFSRLARRQSAAGYALSFDVPASVLREGDYELALKGIATGGSAQDLAYYYFSVAKR